MRIGQKLILGFTGIALLVGAVGYVSVHVSQKALQKSIGESSVSLAAQVLDGIDRSINARIEQFQVCSKDSVIQDVVKKSNLMFKKLDDIQNYINKKDEEWVAATKNEVTAFMSELINNELSEELREKIEFYEEKSGHEVFGEIFVTNKYGVNAAQTGKTSDYYQADEEWWQNTQRDGLYIADVEYDKSAGVYSTDICIRIDDKNGNFIGVIKAVLNVENVINIIKKAEVTAGYGTTQFKLFTKDGKIIYATEDFTFLDDVSDELLSRFHKEKHLDYFIAKGDRPGEEEELFAHAGSTGHGDYKGLGWILIVEHETGKIFAPVAKLKKILLITSFILTTFAVLVGLFISRSISGPIAKLKSAAVEIGEGKLDTQIQVTSNDEIGQLAASFKKMTDDLARTTTSIHNLHGEITKRERVEKEVRRLLSDTTERVKELTCMYGVAESIRKHETLEAVFRDVVKLIPPGWQYSEITRGRVRFDEAEYVSEPFEETPWKQISDIIVNGEKRGTVEVYHLEECPPLDEGPFLKEERHLIDGIVRMLTEVIGRKEAAAELEEVNKQLEDSVDRANRMAQEATLANRAKSTFLAQMSHEIRTPMNAIMGFSEALVSEELTGKQKEHVGIIRKSAGSLLQLINDILDFSKIEAGRLDIEIIDCSLGDLFADIESLMRPVAAEKGLKFEVLQCGKLPANIRTDLTRLRQCLINLVNNAIKFTKKGHVYINVSLQTEPDKPCICFDVEDTGIGISPDKQKAIFEFFTQADESTTRKFGGTGLGLAITKQLAELLGGRVTLTSQPGKGSVFSLTIPAGVDVESGPLLDKYEIVNQMNRRDSEPKTVEQAEFTGHVLVAEDAAANQRLIEFLLEGLGLQVTIVEDGQKAVQAALGRAYDLIFMDMQMPNMSGYEATKKLRDRKITTPIVALTAYAMSGDEEKCLSAGCDDYLSKPVGRQKLLKVLGKYMSSSADNEAVSEKIDVISSQIGELGQEIAGTVSAKAESDSRPVQEAPEEELIDWADLMDRCHDVELGKDIVELFLVDNPAHLKSLAEAVKAGNAVDIKSIAHTIKGSAVAVGAKPLQQAAFELELACEKGKPDKVKNLFGKVQTEFEKLKTFLSNPDWVKTVKQQSTSNKHVK